MNIRHPANSENQRVTRFVQQLVDETYAFVWPEGAPAIDETDWSKGWIAENGGQMIAVMLTSADWLEDLWVARPARGAGLGSKLLATAEEEIGNRSLALARLRVVEGNGHALSFYLKRGWVIASRQAHERLPIVMITMQKQLGLQSAAKQ